MKPCYRHFVILLLFTRIVLYAQQDTLIYPPNSSTIVRAVNFKDTDIKDVLRSIALEYKTNIIVDNNINTKISTALFNLDLYNTIKVIAEDNGFVFSYDANRFIINKKPEKALPKPEEPDITYDKDRITLKLNNIDLDLLTQRLREKTNKNYLITSGTTGKISGSLTNVELDKGLKSIFQNNGYYITQKDSIYYISRSSYYSGTESNAAADKKSYWIHAQDDKVTIDVSQANLDRVINDISNQMGLQIIKLSVPNVNITVRCKDVSLDKALEYLLKGTDFTFKKDKEVYLIGNKTSKILDDTKLLKLNYLRADKLKERLPANLTQPLTVNVSLEHNAFVLAGNRESIMNLEEYIQTIDKPVPQVLIEAIVVDYSLNNTKQFGLTAGIGDSATVNKNSKYLPGLDATLSGSKVNSLLNGIGNFNLFGKNVDIAKLGKLPANFYVNLKALEEKGIANVKSRPLLATLNGHTASLKIGTVQNYVFDDLVPIQSTVSTTYMQKETIEKIEANISFEITPWVGPNDEMTLEIKPEFQTPIGDFVPDKKLIPAINTRSFFSTVRLKDGETIILGGLIQEKETNVEDKIPLLGDIPFLGALFTNVSKVKSKGELIIYITPHITYGDDFGNTFGNLSK